jgi:hypothetical protein
VTAGWVAPSTRGRLLLRRRVGASGARALGSEESWAQARTELATTIYGASLPADADRRTARLCASAATIWQLRVLAGWLPPNATALARTFAASVEIAAVDRHVSRLARQAGARSTGVEPVDAVSLGSLATAWPRVERATTLDQVRSILARSAWGDPGGSDPAAIRFGLRVAWGRRLLRQAPVTTNWVHGAAAVLVARELFLFGRDIPEVPARTIDQLLGPRWRNATSVASLADNVGASASWALLADGSSASPSATDLWRSELGVISRVDEDASRVVESGRNGRNTVAAIMALLLLDLWRVGAAIESAGRGPLPQVVFDDVA